MEELGIVMDVQMLKMIQYVEDVDIIARKMILLHVGHVKSFVVHPVQIVVSMMLWSVLIVIKKKIFGDVKNARIHVIR
jgi:hypothetical protein